MSFISLSEYSDGTEGSNRVLDADDYQKEGNRRLKNHNDIKGSIEAFTKAIVLSKSNYVYYNNRAASYLLLGEFERAIADCDFSLDLCKNVKAYCRKASALGKLRKFDEAITTVMRALDMNPKDNESAVVLETLLKDKSILISDDIDNTPTGIANRELNNKLIQKRASDLIVEGKSHVRNNNFTEGVACFTQAIGLCPHAYKYYYYRAMTHKINGDYKIALRDCETSWRIHKNVDAYNLKGSILSKQKKHNDALDCILQCLDLEPENKTSILLHEKISKEKLSRNRARTMVLIQPPGVLTDRARNLMKSPSVFMSKLSSPKNKDKDDEIPWHQVPLKHTRDETIHRRKGAARIVDRYEWPDVPAEYNRVQHAKQMESRGAKAVRMKNVERKEEEPSKFSQYCSTIYIMVVGAMQRSLATDSSRRSSVTPEMRRPRSLTQV